MKRAKCPKCNQSKFIENHHPLFKSRFKDKASKSYTEPICSSCHDEFHELVKDIEMKTDKEYLFAWYYWLYALILIGICLILIF